ncbi:MAG: bifunctional riboflavin kinase/FAD synthetase [Candidatus Goldiibacteriota bacterium]
MKIIRNIEKHAMRKPAAVVIGAFDGVHTGHQCLIEKAEKKAKKINGRSVLVTFSEHPDKILVKDPEIRLIKNTDYNMELIGKYGIDYVVVLDIKKFADMPAEDFIKKILVKKIRMKYIVTGKDFVFGKNAAGNTELLKKAGRKYGFETEIIPDVKIGKKRISSTLVRQALKNGEIKTVEKMLKRPYMIKGRVVKGRGAGQTLGFPTANIKIRNEEIPARGVWAAAVCIENKKHTGAVNIGFAPTLKKKKAAVIEVFIIDFSGNIYGKTVEVVFLERLRDEKKFRNTEELKKQIAKDVEKIKKKYKKTKGGKE